LSAFYPAAVASLPFLLDPSAGRDGDERAIRENQITRQTSCETKGLEEGSIHFKSDPALCVLAPTPASLQQIIRMRLRVF
jgi:hypothetical protein